MATVIFYEKPGCGNNTKQKVWLAASGHTVLAKNLLIENGARNACCLSSTRCLWRNGSTPAHRA